MKAAGDDSADAAAEAGAGTDAVGGRIEIASCTIDLVN